MCNFDEKLTCKICNKTFQTYRGIITHVFREHDLKSKEYYDCYFKKNNEGLCKYCGQETKYWNINNGYLLSCGWDCSKKKIKNSCIMCGKSYATDQGLHHHIKTFHNISLLDYWKKYQEKNNLIEVKTNKLICQLCYKEINNYKGLITHINKLHNISSKEYYDRYFKSDGYCKECGKETKYKNIKEGYHIFCSLICARKNEDLKETIRKTCLKKYNSNTYMSSKEYRKKQENKGLMVPLEEYTEYELYKRLVWIETKKHEKELYKIWNGKDYYNDQQLILNEEYKKLNPHKHINKNPLQPSIDHKLSISYCYTHNISYKICGEINNLCICSKFSNSQKYNRIELEFKKHLEEQKKVA